MVEKIDFMKSGATNEARQYAETITLEMCKHTAKACGFITTADTDPVNTSDSDAVVRRRKKQTDLNQFFFTLGVASLSGLRRRFYSEKLPEPFPGLTPLLHDRVSAILSRVEFVSVRHDHDPVRFSSRCRGSRRLLRQFSPHARLANHGREDRLHEERRDGRGAGVRRDHHPGDVQAHRPGVRLRHDGGRGAQPLRRIWQGRNTSAQEANGPQPVLLYPRRRLPIGSQAQVLLGEAPRAFSGSDAAAARQGKRDTLPRGIRFGSTRPRPRAFFLEVSRIQAPFAPVFTARATGQPWSRRSTSRRAARRTRRGSTPRPSPWRCASTPPRRAASSRRTRSPAKTTPSGWTSAPPCKRSSSPSACHL